VRALALILIAVLLSSCSVERRINWWSYTNEWHYRSDQRYQVYKTLAGRKYIIVVDSLKIDLKREYLKPAANETRLD
jgi:hypothetical protein